MLRARDPSEALEHVVCAACAATWSEAVRGFIRVNHSDQQPLNQKTLGRPNVVSPGPKSLPAGRNRPLPTGRHRGLSLDENLVLGVKPL